jgi:hypothetical protein
MTPTHDHATLFRAPAAAEPTSRPQPAADGDDGAMRRLRDPFAVEAVQAPAKPLHTA